MHLFADIGKENLSACWALLRLYYYHWGSLPYFILFTVLKFMLWAFQSVSWRINGVLRKLVSNEYENSAHVLRVILSIKPTPFDKARHLWHYMTIHEDFKHPNCVLADEIMLLDVTRTKAIFVQLPRSLANYTVKTHPFLFISTVTDAVKLIEMPLSSLHRLAAEIGDPVCHYERITFLFNIGRSGSTLIAKMIEAADREDTVALSEPPAMFEFVNYMIYTPPYFAEKTLKSAMWLLCKPMLGKKRLLIKPTYFVAHIAEHLRKALPTAKMFYCHRNSLRVIWAQERAFGVSPLYKLLQFSLYSKLWLFICKHVGLQRDGFFEHQLNTCLHSTLFETCLMNWAYCTLRYKAQAELFDFPTIFYDDLFTDPREFCIKLLNTFELPISRLQFAISGLKTDSQDGTILCQDILRNVQVTPYSEELKLRADKFCDHVNLPRLNWNSKSMYPCVQL